MESSNTCLINQLDLFQINKNKGFKRNVINEGPTKTVSPAPCWTDAEFKYLENLEINSTLFSYIEELKIIGWENWKKRLKGAKLKDITTE